MENTASCIIFFFFSLSKSKSIFYTSFSGVTQLQIKRKRVTTLNLHTKSHIPFTQDNSAALKMRCSMWMLLKTCCMSIWLSERFKEQYPGTVLVQQNWFIYLVIMSDLTLQHDKCQKKEAA